MDGREFSYSCYDFVFFRVSMNGIEYLKREKEGEEKFCKWCVKFFFCLTLYKIHNMCYGMARVDNASLVELSSGRKEREKRI